MNAVYPWSLGPSVLFSVLLTLLSATGSHAADSRAKADTQRRLKIVIEDSYDPYSFINDKGEADGFSVDLVRAAAKAMDFELEIRADRWDRAMKELETGRIDLIPLMADSPERHKLFEFSVPYTVVYDAIFFRKGTRGIRSLKDLSGKTVVVTVSDLAQDYLLSSGLSKTMTVVLSTSGPDALMQVSSGKADAAIMPKLIGLVTLRKLNLEGIVVSPQIINAYSRSWCFAVRSGNLELLERLNQGLNIIKRTGEYDAIYKKWFGGLDGARFNLKALLGFGAGAVLFLFGSVVWNVLLKRQVKAKTEHLEVEIAERKRAEQSLRESEYDFRTLAEAMPQIVWSTRADGWNTYFNKQWVDYTGLTQEESRGHGWNKPFHPDDQKRAWNAWQKAVTDKDEYSLECRLRRADGVYRWWLVRGVPLVDSGGKILKWYGTCTDIHALKTAEMALHESRAQLMAALGSMTDAVFISDANGRFVEFNEAFARIHRFKSKDECLRNLAEYPAILDIFMPDGKPAPLEMWALPRALRGETVTSAQYSLLRKDTGEAWVGEYSFAPIRDKDGAIVGAVVVGRDITERKQAATDLERFRTAIEQVSESTVITDLEGAILFVNPAFEAATGYSREEIVGKNPRILKSGKQDAAFYREMWATISSGRTWKGRIVDKHKNGSFLVSDTIISPVRGIDGRLINYVAVKRDVTDQLRLEENLRQSQKMESVGRLAGGVAHDFNNILTAINGYAGFALAGLPEGDPRREDLNEVVAAAARATRLTRQLLAFSRKQILSPEILDINASVGGIVNMLKRLIGEDIRFVTQLAAHPCMAKVDAGQIEQVFLNLAVNARDAMSKGGTLTFETTIATPAEDFALRFPDMPRSPMVCLSVRDTGCGMTDEVKAHLFEPFFTTKERGKGTGLGLATVFGIIKQSGGAIEVESVLDRGTTFRIYFPQIAIQAQRKDKDKDKDKDAILRGNETVLFVEDEDGLRRLGARILTSNGYEVLVAANGKDALKVLETHGRPVDLLITDVVMPGMSGRELAKVIASKSLARRTLFVSGFTDDAIVVHGVLEAGLAFMYKPFSPAALLLKTREVLDGPADRAKA